MVRAVIDRAGIDELVGLVDQLERTLERSGLSELELEYEGTTVILRTPGAVASVALATVPGAVAAGELPGPPPLVDEAAVERGAHAITAPLTGLFYRSPSPDAEPYVP